MRKDRIFSVVSIYLISNSTFRECDATIINTSYAYEPVILDAMKQWFFGMRKELYVLGPHLPSGYSIETQNGEGGKSFDIEFFLGEMLVQHGKDSVFYVVEFFLSSAFQLNKISPQISFGTLFYPPVSEYVDELIEALIEKKAPFVSDSCFNYNILCLFYQVFAHASPSVKISEEMIEKVKSSRLGKLTTWSPQQLILNHPVLYSYSLTCPDSIIKFFYCRQLDGSLPTVDLMVLLNLLGAVSLCKVFSSDLLLVLTFFVGFAGPLSQTNQVRLHI